MMNANDDDVPVQVRKLADGRVKASQGGLTVVAANATEAKRLLQALRAQRAATPSGAVLVR